MRLLKHPRARSAGPGRGPVALTAGLALLALVFFSQLIRGRRAARASPEQASAPNA